MDPLAQGVCGHNYHVCSLRVDIYFKGLESVSRTY